MKGVSILLSTTQFNNEYIVMIDTSCLTWLLCGQHVLGFVHFHFHYSTMPHLILIYDQSAPHVVVEASSFLPHCFLTSNICIPHGH